MVTVLPPTEPVVDEVWFLAAQQALSAAYGTDEPDYGVKDLR
jgi:hypothetical protein